MARQSGRNIRSWVEAANVLSIPFASVFPTGAPREFFPFSNLWRGVEGSRRSILCDAAVGRSPQTVSRDILTLKRCNRRVGNPSVLAKPGTLRKATVSGTMHGKNSLWQHDQEWFLGSLHSAPQSSARHKIPAALRSGRQALMDFERDRIYQRRSPLS